ncbi:hypothetical protein E2C01_051498 [Portunus trituberculatus]|uniref:Uncharacterized protein n=1 Tax=Portunus trituberculatus TaxID=210409 RepID=A0A5B7GJP8_PORTR|nr:hypothetical protein [Portunus trituberculatus]
MNRLGMIPGRISPPLRVQHTVSVSLRRKQ